MTILCSVSNKRRLQVLIKSHLSEISHSVAMMFLNYVGVECVCLSSGSNRDDLGFNHCEADTIMLSIYSSLMSSSYSDPIIIDTEDTDG